jgi:hypothetical protein
MAGGLLNLVSTGQQSLILNGNPSKTFWKCAYKKYTNFGLQKFRVDFEGSSTMKLTEKSTFFFKIPRYADLLMDCYLSVALPNIWSPILPPAVVPITEAERIAAAEKKGEIIVEVAGSSTVDEIVYTDCRTFTNWAPYEFKWIENLGAMMISKIEIHCGNQKLQEFSGYYLLSLAQRDFSEPKLKLFYEMIGNIPELTDPANADGREKQYPNAFFTENPVGAEPSIRGRILYIPLNAWFTMATQLAFPLISLQYNELHIYVTMRPINELFQIRDVMDYVNNFPYIAPNFNQYYMQMYRFLQTPPDIDLGILSYTDQRSIWNADIHLNCTYCFLSNDESKVFAFNEQQYLFKQVNEKVFYNITGNQKVDLDSLGLISNWMFFFQRSDANLRNEWTNYTNWPYQDILPSNVERAPYCIIDRLHPSTKSRAAAEATVALTQSLVDSSINQFCCQLIGPGLNPNGTPTGLYLTGNFHPENAKEILLFLGILLDGTYRENLQPAGVFNFIEKYVRTDGKAPFGLFCYNFALHSDPYQLQPSGAINMNRFNLVQFEFSTITPSLDPYAQVLTICDPATGNIIGVNKPTWRIYEYNFNLYIMEERINIVHFIGGNAALMYAT